MDRVIGNKQLQMQLDFQLPPLARTSLLSPSDSETVDECGTHYQPDVNPYASPDAVHRIQPHFIEVSEEKQYNIENAKQTPRETINQPFPLFNPQLQTRLDKTILD